MGFGLRGSGVQSGNLIPLSWLLRPRAVSVLEGLRSWLSIQTYGSGVWALSSGLGGGESTRTDLGAFGPLAVMGSVGQTDTRRGGAAPPDCGRKLQKNGT